MGGVWEWQIRSARSIFVALQKHGESLLDESLRTVLVEIKGIISSKPITCDNMGDVNSIVSLYLMQLLSIKTKIVMPPPGIFQEEDMYCRRYWPRIQHVCNEFWARWKTKFLLHYKHVKNEIAQNKNFKLVMLCWYRMIQ